MQIAQKFIVLFKHDSRHSEHTVNNYVHHQRIGKVFAY